MYSEDSEIISIFISAIAVVVLMAILIAFFVFIYQKRLLKQDQSLQKMKSDFQMGLLKATIEGQERERKRLAKELHDGIGSLLTGLNLNLKHQLNTQTEKGGQNIFLQEACTMLEEGIGDVRRISHDLLPITLDNFGLVLALKEWTETLQKEDFNVTLKVEGRERRLRDKVELGILRVIQELIQNTIKHAQASNVSIVLTFTDKKLNLSYLDNGKGCNTAQNANGLGIKNMQSRIQALDGTIEFNSGIQKGFNAQVKVPINEKHEQLHKNSTS